MRPIMYRAWDPNDQVLWKVKSLSVGPGVNMTKAQLYQPDRQPRRQYLEKLVDLTTVVVDEYAGFTDANHRPIFEGDILKAVNGQYYLVTHRRSGFLIGGYRADSMYADGMWPYYYAGNIHQNYNLLRKER